MVFNLKKSNLSKRSFDEIYLEAVDEALTMLGNSCSQAVYFHLEKTFQIDRKDIPSKIDDFTQAIESIFGVGATLIEIRIMKNLRKRVKHLKYFPNGEITFSEYVKAARYSCIQKRQN